jgi:uncharacterized protein YbjT (DUF2867 family)
LAPYTVTVFGATGKTGQLIVREALGRGWRARAAMRRRPAIGEWERLEWDRPESWPNAFSGSQAAYVLIPFRHPGAPDTAPQLLQTAAEAGVRRIVLLSSLDAEHADADDPLIRAETALRQLPVEHAILRATWFFDNFSVGSFAAMTRAGELRLPAGCGRIPFIDIRDVAAVATEALAADGPTGTLPLTGPAAIDHAELADALSASLGYPIRYTTVAESEFVELLVRQGFSKDYGRFLATQLCALDEGRVTIPVHNTVREVCGRDAYTVRDFATNFASRLRPTPE